MPIHSLSKETFNELKEQIQKKKDELKVTQETPIEETWLNELKELKEKLKKS